MVTLIFPAFAPSAPEYLEAAKRRGETVIAASSVADPAMETEFGELISLPYIYDETFRERFLALAQAKKITQIYAPVASVYAFLQTFLAEEKLPIQMIGESPIDIQLEAYRKLFRKAENARPFIECCGGGEALSQMDIAAVLRYAWLIYGESNEEKIAAMMAIFPTAPKGDVVEIGSLMGRSVFALHYLARHYNIGPVLSVDPLSSDAAIQNDSPSVALGLTRIQLDFPLVQKAVVVNLLPVSNGDFNFLRMESDQGFSVYQSQPSISSEYFGEVSYNGKIAVIHIDGNHDYAQVKKDCELWLTRLVPGAWLILDDYLWAHGDGPHRVGNALLKERWEDIERSFVCGKALFVKFK